MFDFITKYECDGSCAGVCVVDYQSVFAYSIYQNIAALNEETEALERNTVAILQARQLEGQEYRRKNPEQKDPLSWQIKRDIVFDNVFKDIFDDGYEAGYEDGFHDGYKCSKKYYDKYVR